MWILGGVAVNSFWNTETSGQATSAGGTGKTTDEMKDVTTFTNTSTEGLDNPWDFIANPNDDEVDENIWHISPDINNGYPFLVSFYNQLPIVDNLGPENLTDGSIIDSDNPHFTFDLSDPDEGDNVGYQIQIAVSPDFTSLVVDYTSALGSQGEVSFTVGQNDNAGTYIIGEESQTLPEEGSYNYYWRVRALDDFGSFSDWVVANDNEKAFRYQLPFEGSGTAEDPYVITDVGELQLIACDLSAHYILGNDIDASETEEWHDGDGWVTIGDSENPFTGSLDGQGYVISDLYINRPEESQLSLFNNLSDTAEVKNLGLDNVNFIGLSSVAGLVVFNFGNISGVYVSGSLFGSMVVAGLAVQNMGGTISNSYFEGSIESEVYGVGLVWENYGTITNTYSTGPISVEFFGLCGLVCADYSEDPENDPRTINSFWDMETTGVTELSEGGGGTGKTTSEMKTLATFTDWNIAPIGSYVDETWYIDEGNDYPRLGWQHSSPGEPEPDPDPQPQPTRRRITGSVASPRVTPTPSTPPTITQLTTTLNQLQAQLNALLASRGLTPSSPTPGPHTPTPVFTRNLTLGDTGPDARALQVFLNTNGFVLTTTGPGSPGNETERFGPLTQASLVRFQTAHNITPALGYFGPVTRAKVLEIMGR